MAVKIEQDLTGLVKLMYRSRVVIPLMHAIGMYLVNETHKNFKVGGRPRKWEPSKRVLESKYKRITVEKSGANVPVYLRGRTLIRTGRLYQSIAYKGDVREGRLKVAVGTNVEYGIYHQYGVPARHIPARPFLVVLPEFEDKIRKIVAEWIEHGRTK